MKINQASWQKAGADRFLIADIAANKTGPEKNLYAARLVARALANGSLSQQDFEALAPTLHEMLGRLPPRVVTLVRSLREGGYLPGRTGSLKQIGQGSISFRGREASPYGSWSSPRSVLLTPANWTISRAENGKGVVELYIRYPLHNELAHSESLFPNQSDTISDGHSFFIIDDIDSIILPSFESASGDEAGEILARMLRLLREQASASWHEYATGFGEVGRHEHALFEMGPQSWPSPSRQSYTIRWMGFASYEGNSWAPVEDPPATANVAARTAAAVAALLYLPEPR